MAKEIEQCALNMNEAAKYLGVALPTMKRLLEKKDFPAFKIGRRWVIPKRALANWLDKQAKEHTVFNMEEE